MRVLRLGNSEDISHGIADHERGWHIAASLLEEACGEPVETILRPIRPSPDLPKRIEEWLDEFEPDLVFLKVTWYWYAYESVPLRIRRVMGRAGKPIASAGIKASKNQRLARNRVFKLGRRMAHRIIGGDTPYNTHDITELMTVVIRQIHSRESVALTVKGTGGAEQNQDALAGYYHRFVSRREEVEGTIKRLCADLRIPWNQPAPRPAGYQGMKGTDGVHGNSVGQERMGLQEGNAMVDAWRHYNGIPADAAEAS